MDGATVSEQADDASRTTASTDHWTSTDSWVLGALGLGLLMDSYIFGMTSLATRWVTVPVTLRSLLLAWAPIWNIVGLVGAGLLVDRLGRKPMFYATAALIGVGAIGLAFSATYWLILLFLAILIVSAAIELPAVLTLVQETMPTRHRSKAVFMVVNCANLGGLLLGTAALLTIGRTVSVQRGMVAAVVLLVLGLWFVGRQRTPESIRWLERTGKRERAQAEIERYYGAEAYRARQASADGAGPEGKAGGAARSSLPLRLYCAISMALANMLGFGLMAYVIGPVFFKELTPIIIFVVNATAFVSGFFGLWADRVSRRRLLLTGYLGSLAMAIVAFVGLPSWQHSLPLFLLILVLYNVFVNVQYLSQDALKSEIWSTQRRAVFTVIVTIAANGVGYVGSIFLVPHLGLRNTILYIIAAWVVGSVAALVWYRYGRETGEGVSVGYASGEVGAAEEPIPA